MAQRTSSKDNATLAGTSGADTLTVFGQNTVLDGGAGNDTYFLRDDDYRDGGWAQWWSSGWHYSFTEGEFSAEGATIIETATGGTADKVIVDGGYWSENGFALTENLENLSLVGYADWGYGNAANNILDASKAFEGGRDAGPTPWWWSPPSVIWLGGAGGNDTLTGSDYRDQLDGGTGNDLLNGGRGEDTLFGEDGNDTLNGAYGDDMLNGGAGNDTLNGGDATEVAFQDDYGYGGNDALFGGDGNDVLNGGNNTLSSDGYGAVLYGGDDYLDGGNGNDVLNGGNDVLSVTDLTTSADSMHGGEDMFFGGDGNDTLNGGDDRFTGGNGRFVYNDDEVFYGAVDKFYGGDGNDVINIGDTTINANGGNDVVYGAYGVAHGEDGNDTINGGIATLNGGAGDDIIRVAGDDSSDEQYFLGGYGNDAINGGTATATGGTGSDKLYGSTDIFYGDEWDSGAGGSDDGNDSIRGRNVTLDAGAGDDYIYAGYSTYYGGGGNDTITGGNTTVLGGAGNDRIYTGGEDFQLLSGGDGNDILTAGNLIITDTVGENRIYGDYGRGVGYADLFGGDGNDILNGANGSDYLDGGNGNDTLNGNVGDDELDGGNGSDTLNGGTGNDTLAGGDWDQSADVLAGGAGDDTYYIAWYGGADTISADTGGDDTVFFYGATFTAATGIENIISTGYGDQTLTGNAVDNYIYGEDGDDVLVGLGGNDVLDGGDGDDSMEGGAGNDTYIFSSYGDQAIEAAGAAGGTDTIYVFSYGDRNLAANVENMTLGNGAYGSTIIGNSLNNVLTGNFWDNTLYGGAGTDTLSSGGGSDLLFGGAGDDLYIVGGGDDGVFEVSGAAGSGVDTVRSNGDFRLGANLENLILTDGVYGTGFAGYGNALANRIEGTSGGDYLVGGAGNDTLIGGAGNDQYVVDSLTDVVTELADGGSDSVYVNTAGLTGGLITLTNVENGYLRGAGNVSLTGNAADNRMYGNAGGNTLTGNAGHDTLAGLAGNDTLFGGDGNDRLFGGRGSDKMEGGLGDDTYYVDRGDGFGGVIGQEDVVVDTGGIDTVHSAVYNYTLEAGIEKLYLDYNNVARKATGNGSDNGMYGNGLGNVLDGGAGNDKLFGNGGNDTLLGGAGNDVLDGGSGNDRLEGGLGNDIYIVDSGSDIAFEATTTVVGGAGTDLVQSWTNTFTLGTDVENLTLFDGAVDGNGNSLANVIIGNSNGNYLNGAAGNDTLTGNGGSDNLYGGLGNDTMFGGDGDDALNGTVGPSVVGGSGTDSMSGGAGSDIYYIDSLADVVVEAVNGGNDTIRVISDTELVLTLAANVENISTGWYFTDVGHNVTGNALNNGMWGDSGINTLSGGLGNDTIRGAESSSDSVDGGDSLSGNEGNDFLYGYLGNDTLNGGAGNDFLSGGLGDDTLIGDVGNDYLYGGAGNDTMTGGAGNDTYRINDAGGGDTITENSGGGTDKVEIFRGDGVTAYTLAAEVENYDVWGYSGTAIAATGNLLANVFTVDDLNGGDGSVSGGDSIDGGGGLAIDTLNARLISEGAGDGEVTLAGFEKVNLHVELLDNDDWIIDAGNVAGQVLSINGWVVNNVNVNSSSLEIKGLAADATVVLGDDHSFDGGPGGIVELNLETDTLTDTLNIVLGNVGADSVNLATTDIETLNFDVRGDHNSINVLGATTTDLVPGDSLPLLNFSGATQSLAVGGLSSGETIQLENFSAVDLNLSLDHGGYGNTDTLNLELDNVVISGSGLNTDNIYSGGGGMYGLEFLNITVDGGASYINGSGIDLNTDVVLDGGGTLMLANFGGDDFDASNFGGDLSGTWGDGDTTFNGGVGDYNIDLGGGSDYIYFELDALGDGTLDDNDVVDGGDDFAWDQLTATFSAGSTTLHIHNVDGVNLYMGVSGEVGTFDFDLQDVSTSGTLGIGILGYAGTASVVTRSEGNTTVSASGATVTNGISITTGSGSDSLTGTAGNDTLNGGKGGDWLEGGSGSDTFVFDNLDGNYDQVYDFISVTDKLELSLTAFAGIGEVGLFDADTLAFGTTAGDADDRLIYDSSGGSLYYDGDGNGADVAILIATFLGTPPTLTAGDFTVGA